MLIGIDASRANKSHKTGTEWYSYHLIRSLAKIDVKNQYLLYTDSPLGPGLADLTNEENSNYEEFKAAYDRKGFQTVLSPHNNFKAKILKWPYKSFWTLGRLSLECLFFSPDVLFVPAHTLPVLHPRKSLVTIHDIGFKKRQSLYRREPMGPEGKNKKRIVNFLARIFTFGKFGADARDYLEWSTKFALKNAKKIITVSNSSKKDILDFYSIKPEKISVVYNAYNNKAFRPAAGREKISAVLDKYGISGDYIFYAGKIEKKKNIPALIEAFAMMRDNNPLMREKLVLAGDAFYGYDEVNYLIREFNLDDEVVLPGWISEDDMPYIYAGAKAFIMPSNYESFGIVLLEAMACGVPIAAANVASIPEVLNGAGILFDPSNIRDMSEAMKKIIIDDKLRADLIEKGQKRVKDFSWEKCAQETLAVINSL